MIELILVALAAFLIVALFVTAVKKTFKIGIYIVLFFAVFSFIGAKFLPEADFLDRGKGYIVGKAGEVVDDAKESVAEKIDEEIDDAKQALKEKINDSLAEVREAADIKMEFE